MPPTPPTSSPSTPPAEPGAQRPVTGLVVSPWNLLLLVPLVMLVTPWFNRTDPKLAGLPFFYWFQFACVIVGVACVWIVYAATRKKPVNAVSVDHLSVDDLDEGGRS
jgi:uncharacterized protein DUF3311